MKRIFCKLRLLSKNLVCRIGYGDRLIEYCQQCGRNQPVVWHCDDHQWVEVVGKKGGVLCPECYDFRAADKGLTVIWKPIFTLLIPLLLLFVSACTSCLKDGSSAVSTIGVVGSYTPSGDTWSVGIQIAFKEGPPSAETVGKLELAQAVRVKVAPVEIWVIAKSDRYNIDQNKAVQASLREGATVSQAR